MTGCIYKRGDGRCDKPGKYMAFCIGEACSSQTPSNYDLMISKTPEEMAEWLSEVAGWISPYEGRVHPLLDWLKAPAEKEGEG